MKKNLLHIGLVSVPPCRLRSDLHLARKSWHFLMGLVIVFFYASGVSPFYALSILCFCFLTNLLFEGLRLKNQAFNLQWVRFWAPIMRQHEVRGLTTVSHYLASVILSIAIFPKEVALLSILYLACGDPFASLMGILYGHKGPTFSSGKTWMGTGSGVLMCMVLTWIYLGVLGVSSWMQLSLISIFGGLVGGTAELLPFEADDNFVIPVVSGFVLWFLFMVVGFF